MDKGASFTFALDPILPCLSCPPLGRRELGKDWTLAPKEQSKVTFLTFLP
jgi:hypothetical protein